MENAFRKIQRKKFEKINLKTSNFNVHTEYENVKDRNENYNRIFKGYVVDYSLKLEFDFAMQRLWQALSAIAGCLSNPDLSIQFTVKDATAVNEEMFRSAAMNAQAITSGDVQKGIGGGLAPTGAAEENAPTSKRSGDFVSRSHCLYASISTIFWTYK